MHRVRVPPPNAVPRPGDNQQRFRMDSIATVDWVRILSVVVAGALAWFGVRAILRAALIARASPSSTCT